MTVVIPWHPKPVGCGVLTTVKYYRGKFEPPPFVGYLKTLGRSGFGRRHAATRSPPALPPRARGKAATAPPGTPCGHPRPPLCGDLRCPPQLTELRLTELKSTVLRLNRFTLTVINTIYKMSPSCTDLHPLRFASVTNSLYLRYRK